MEKSNGSRARQILAEIHFPFSLFWSRPMAECILLSASSSVLCPEIGLLHFLWAILNLQRHKEHLLRINLPVFRLLLINRG